MTDIHAHPIRAVIFDFDGVIADTESLHYETLAETVATIGLRITPDEYADVYMVYDDRDGIRAAFLEAGRTPSDEEVARLMAYKAALFDRRIRAGVPLFPGVVACLRSLAERYPLVIASGALKAEIRAILASHRLDDLFLGIVAADDVEKGKPHPETYLRACDLLNERLDAAPPIVPAECLVVEDTVAGVQGARAAGMRVLAVTNSYPAERLGEADVIVSTLEGFTPERLAALFEGKSTSESS